jgi:hypothetical protein
MTGRPRSAPEPASRAPLALAGWALLGAVLLPARAAAASPSTSRDVGRSFPSKAPRALLVVTPGQDIRESAVFIEAMEAEGVDVFAIAFPVERQRLPDMVHDIQAAVVARAPIALTGHGLGGTIAILAAAETPPDRAPAAVAVVGAPLLAPQQRLTTWLAAKPIPELGLDLSSEAATAATWNGLPVLPLLLGGPLTSTRPMSADWLATLQSWTAKDWKAPVERVAAPLWAGAGALDNLAPPEAVHPALPKDATFVRFGLLHLDPSDPTHLDLLRQPTAAHAMGAWLRHTLLGTKEPPAE